MNNESDRDKMDELIASVNACDTGPNVSLGACWDISRLLVNELNAHLLAAKGITRQEHQTFMKVTAGIRSRLSNLLMFLELSQKLEGDSDD